jgi:hypothetical protein
MPAGADPLDTLARAAARLDGEDNGLQLVADWLRQGAPGDLFEHLGAENRRGHSARREAAYARRNAALRAAAARWSDLPPADQARLLHAELGRYSAIAWARERHHATNPHPPGSMRWHLWAALAAVDRVPGRRQIQRILTGDRL